MRGVLRAVDQIDPVQAGINGHGHSLNVPVVADGPPRPKRSQVRRAFTTRWGKGPQAMRRRRSRRDWRPKGERLPRPRF